VAAVLYGIGARLDEQPDLLFHLRGVDHKDLVTDLGKDLPLAKTPPPSARILEGDDMAALFGLDIAVEDSLTPSPDTPPKKSAPRRKQATTAKPDLELTQDGYVKWWK
jgi:uncharacterized Zn finger protein